MIARTWRGWTKTEDADDYVDYLQETGIDEYRATPGNRAAYILRRRDGDRTEFVALTLWSSLDAVKAFAGEDVEQAVFYPEDDRFLVERETVAHHYEVFEPRGRPGPVNELRLAVTVDRYDEALAFYRDGLGLPVVYAWDEPSGSGAILDAGRATLELFSVAQAELVDRIEVGERVAGPVRIALEVEDSEETARNLVAEGAELLGGPVVTPWSHRNVRLRAPDGMQLTLFTVLDGDTGQPSSVPDPNG